MVSNMFDARNQSFKDNTYLKYNRIEPKNEKIKNITESPHPLLDRLRENAPYSFLDFLKYVKIDGKGKNGRDSGVQTFVLHQEQKQLFDEMMAQYDAPYDRIVVHEDGTEEVIKDKRKFVRLAVAKSRQVGTSTFFTIFWLYVCLVMKKNLAVINHTNDKNKNLHRKLCLAFDHLPSTIRGDLIRTGSGEKEIKFNIVNKFRGRKGAITTSQIAFHSSETPGGVRGNTFKGLLLTECGFYAQSKNVDLQSIALEPNTFIIYESTPWGQGNVLSDVYAACKNDRSEHNVTKMIFQKWWKMDEYRIQPPEGYVPNAKILAYLKKYKFKIIEKTELNQADIDVFESQGVECISMSNVYFIEYKLANDPDVCDLDRFSKSYPPSLEACFTNSVSSCFCNVQFAEKALNAGRNPRNILTSAIEYPVYIGVDVAYKHDRTCISVRQGPNVLMVKYLDFNESAERHASEELDYDKRSYADRIAFAKGHEILARELYELADDLARDGKIIARINIDATNSDVSAVQELKGLFSNNQDKRDYTRVHPSVVRPIHFASTIETPGLMHRTMPTRDYMYFKFASWLEHFRLSGCYIYYVPELLEEIQATLTFMGTHGDLRIIEKVKVRKNIPGGRSPDALDSVVLTMHGDEFFGIKTETERLDPYWNAPKRQFPS